MDRLIRATRRRSFAAVILLAIIALMIPMLGTVEAQADRSAYWQELNTEIVVNADGTFHVTETQVVSFNGRFSHGNADIPTTRMESMENIQVSVANSVDEEPEPFEQVSQDRGEAGTFVVYEYGDYNDIVYNFEPTSGSEERVIVIEFDVVGGLRYYPDEDPANQQLWWVAVSSDVTSAAQVDRSTVTVHLPEAVDSDDTVWQPEEGESDGQTWTWERINLASGSQFEVRLQFPPITDAHVPAWQERDDLLREQEEEQEGRNAVAGTIYLGTGLLLGVGGTLFIVLRWYSQGRDPKVGLVADILSEPPDDLHPGAAGVLIDQRTDTRDVVATLVDLGRRHIIHISDAREEGGIAGFGSTTVYDIELIDLDKPMKDYERKLLDAIFPGRLEVGMVTPMHKATERMQQHATEIHRGFYQEVVDHGYFDERPDKVRNRNAMIGIFAPVIALVVWFLVSQGYGGESGWAFFMAFAAGFVLFLGVTMGSAMVRRTEKGAEAAAKWEAFKRYLQDIDKNLKLEESQAIYERYLPYAVAFGIENSWVTKFERAGAATPDWFGGGGPVIIHTGHGQRGHSRRRGGTWVYGGGSLPGHSPGERSPGSGGGGGWNIPDMQGGSDSAARGLGGASGSLLGMLGTAAKVLSESSGRGGGGGFGGGGGGFSGGGGFGGGGGGGGRGFG